MSPYKTEGLHFAISVLPKKYCDVKLAEIAKAYRLTKDNRIEKISFTVPRVKLGYFQDDLFPDTMDKSQAYVSASEWFSGANFEFNYIKLQPAGMQRLTEILAVEQSQPPKPSKATQLRNLDNQQKDLYNPENLNDDEKKIINSMLHRATLFYKEKSDDDENENSEWN